MSLEKIINLYNMNLIFENYFVKWCIILPRITYSAVNLSQGTFLGRKTHFVLHLYFSNFILDGSCEKLHNLSTNIAIHVCFIFNFGLKLKVCPRLISELFEHKYLVWLTLHHFKIYNNVEFINIREWNHNSYININLYCPNDVYMQYAIW